MFDRITRDAKDILLRPITALIPHGISPTTITVVGILPGLATAALAASGAWGWAIAAFVLNRMLDGVDGLLARARGRQTDLGGYIDIMADFLIYAVIPIGVYHGAADTAVGVATPIGAAAAPAWPVYVLLAAFYLNAASWMYLSALLEKRSTEDAASPTNRATSVAMPAGIIEGTETVGFFLLFLLFPRWYPHLFVMMTAFTLIGTGQRVVWAVRHLDSP